MTPQQDPFLWLALWLKRETRLDAGLRRSIVHRVTVLIFQGHQLNCDGQCYHYPFLCPYCKEYGVIAEKTPTFDHASNEYTITYHWFHRKVIIRVSALVFEQYFRTSPVYCHLPDTPAYAPTSPDPVSPPGAKRVCLDLDLLSARDEEEDKDDDDDEPK